VPLLVFADQRNRYLDALEEADRDRPDGLIEFFAQRVIDAIVLVELRLQAPQATAQEAAAAVAATVVAPERRWEKAADRLELMASGRPSGVGVIGGAPLGRGVDGYPVRDVLEGMTAWRAPRRYV
jgi:hypothetical protein